ncbi:site-2 protease family protein [bacterium]|nr:site-2 protease family protein [candidate division CSSED10-310 bacterium]
MEQFSTDNFRYIGNNRLRNFTEQDQIPLNKSGSAFTPWFLFFLTVFSTIIAGALQQNLNPFHPLTNMLYGIPFSFTLLLILGIHESGHYFMCKVHGIPSTVPYFIPIPNILGTLGAFIKIKGIIPNRRALLDIGMAGPLAGFVVALPATVIGFILSTPAPVFYPDTVTFGDSLLVKGLSLIVFPNLPDGFEIILHPVGFAGYIGLLVTALNLLPVSQLDGGHIASALFGEKQWHIAKYFMMFLFALGFLWKGWWIWLLILTIMGYRHPVIRSDARPLGKNRRYLAWATIIIFFLTFVPIPFIV